MESLAESPAPQLPEILPVEGGHMFYQKCLVINGDEATFIKAFDPNMFSNPAARDHTLKHLRKEGQIYQTLYEAGFSHLPGKFAYENDVLYLSACLPQQGWHWELPSQPAMRKQYITDVLGAFTDLEKLPMSLLAESNQSSMLEVYEQGWLKLAHHDARQKALDRLEEFRSDFHPQVSAGVQVLKEFLGSSFESCMAVVANHLMQPQTVIGHFDARQTNVAWHPEHGVAIVDWSWASPAPALADRTMFLIDLFKSDCSVDDLVDEGFNPGYALLQIGHWMARSTAPGHNGDDTVRFHQMASAVSAASLLYDV